MLVTQTHQLRHLSKEDYTTLRRLCQLSKNIYNVALYNVKQHYIAEGKYLRYESNYHVCKENENYKLLGTEISQQTMKMVDQNFDSFFASLKVRKQSQKINTPNYLPKDSYYTIIITRPNIKDGYFTLPMSPAFKKQYSKLKIKFPINLDKDKIHQIRIYPKHNAKYFYIEYIYEIEEQKQELDNTKFISIDFGLDNLATCITNNGKSFIIDGKKPKSDNQWYNKYNSQLQSIKDKQGVKYVTKKQYLITKKRNNQIKDYINKTARYIIDYCLENEIGNLIVGYNIEFKKNINIGRINNQKFTLMPIAKLKNKIKYLCERYGINYIEQEESYTSKASFFDNDFIPIINLDNPKDFEFSGKRISRGQYKTKYGNIINADVNGALNIMSKSNLVALEELQSRGHLAWPVRIKLTK